MPKKIKNIPKKSKKKHYIPNVKEKYMCAKHKKFFNDELVRWRKDIISSNSLSNMLNSSDDNISSADVVDQASSYTDKSVEMKALTRSRKLIEKIDAAIRRIKDGTYGYCEETSEPIGLKRLMARPVATLSIEAQEKHERDEKIYVED
jgi:DnaK suppressor protein|tara:strand:- start:9 stop:452 length:444 start_codon:yes stop_codon:yes gene_type:complete